VCGGAAGAGATTTGCLDNPGNDPIEDLLETGAGAPRRHAGEGVSGILGTGPDPVGEPGEPASMRVEVDIAALLPVGAEDVGLESGTSLKVDGGFVA
jgi:hypothetical protein